MRGSRLALLLIAFLLACCLQGAVAFDKATPPAERNAILFSWDGVQRNHLNECLKANQLPNLAQLIKEGHIVSIDVVSHQTDTKAGHTQMLTGYEPTVTGVYSNSKYKPIPLGYTIFEDLQAQFGKDKIATVMLTGKSHHIGSMGPGQAGEIKQPAKAKKANATNQANQGKKAKQRKARQAKQAAQADAAGQTTGKQSTVAEDEETAKLAPRKRAAAAAKQAADTNKQGEPWYLVKKNFTIWDGDVSRTAEQVGPKAVGYVDQFASQRFFAFFHFSDPDHMGHAHGENSKEYTDAVIDCDKWLGKIVAELKAKKLYDKTIIFVTADHGFDEGKTSHKNAPYVTLATNDTSVTKDGDQRDIVPTILKEMGADLAKVSPKLPGKPLIGE